MSVLEWLLIIEVVLIFTALFFGIVAKFVNRGDPDDPFQKFYGTFWKVFFRKRGRLRSAVTALDVEKARQYEEMKQSGDVEGIKELLTAEFGEHQFDESEISDALDESIAATSVQPEESDAAGAGGGSRVAIINITVIPFAQQDELVSMRSDGITIQVTHGPEEGQANKAVIDLVAQALQVKAYQVTLLKGHYKPQKTLQIAGIDQFELDRKMASYS